MREAGRTELRKSNEGGGKEELRKSNEGGGKDRAEKVKCGKREVQGWGP
jgi:hypothetical protein